MERPRCLSQSKVQIVCQLPRMTYILLYLERCLLGCNVLNLAQICIKCFGGYSSCHFHDKSLYNFVPRLCVIRCTELKDCNKMCEGKSVTLN